ncbi:MAG TPA: hypothetical protein DCS43_00580 [Verrucomicrobia bacterium]|nr:hypothetical protein [Verrucomicrobiota bacterium]
MIADGTPDNPAAGRTELAALRDEIMLDRARSRSVMGWFVSFFVLVVLAAVALLLLAGITVLRQAREVQGALIGLQDDGAVHSVSLAVTTNRLVDIERTQLSLSTRLGALQTAQEQTLERLSSEIQQQRRWIDDREATDARDQRVLGERLLAMGEDAARMASELDAMRRRVDAIVALDGMVVVADRGAPLQDATPRGAAPAGGGTQQASLDILKVESMQTMFDAVVAETAVPERDKSVPTTISVVTFPNGDRYEGEFRHGLMHGWGVYVTKLGDRYEGRFENDLRSGSATQTTASGERYTGLFVKGIRHGRGSLTMVDGTRYAGDFHNDLINGRGVMISPDGGTYAGDFMNGRRHGQGIIRFPNGDIYEGEFRSDLRTGKGTYRFTDGAVYVGDFVEGVRHGSGRYTATDGAVYVGPFKEGRMHGEGVRIYPDGQRVKGLWREGEYLRDIRD